MSKKHKDRPALPRFNAPVVDSHAHLEPEHLGGDEGVKAAVERAFAAGLSGIIAIGAGFGPEAAWRAVHLARQYPARMKATVGLHPHQARLGDAAVYACFREVAREPEIVAVGEIGLDFHYDFSPRDVQRAAFRTQIRLALELDLPILVHDRETEGETFRILCEERAFSGRGVLYHCFSGGLAELEALLSAGGYVSLPGVVTWPRSVLSHDVARRVPLDRLMVETDTPYLAPEPWRGHANEPAFTLYTVAAIARLRAVPPEVVATATTANVERFFQWKIEP